MRIGLRESGGAGGRVADIALPAVAAFALTAAPILLHLVSQPLAIAFCLTTSCFVALYFERAIPFVILVSYLFQTMFVAMASPYVAQYSDLDPMKAYNFITTVGFWLTLMARLALGLDRASPFLWRLVLATTAVTTDMARPPKLAEAVPFCCAPAGSLQNPCREAHSR